MRRILIVALALVLAVVGGVVTFSYAAGADARAMAGMQPTTVLVVAEPIAQGTPAEELPGLLATAEVPASAVVPGALVDLSSLEGTVATTDLEPGEQLLASRFAAPDALGGAVQVPEGLLLMSIELEPRRVIGGDLQPGDRIAIFVSEGGDGAPDATNLLQRDVLVVDVAGGASVATDEAGVQTEQPASPSVMVTVAVDPTASQQLVFAIEYEIVYLSLESESAPKDDLALLTDVIGQ